jgi:hypothetical protein
MEEILWTMEQRSRTLQDYREDISNAWDDEAAKTLNSRYLNPHEEDDQKMITSLGQQKQGLEKASVELLKAKDHALKADSYSQKVSHFLEIERQEVTQAYHSYNLSLEYHAATQSELPKIEQLIYQANHAC